MKRLVQCAAIAAMMSISASVPAAADDVLELEGALVGSVAGLGPAFRLGFVLTDRLTIGVGVSATGYYSEATGGAAGLGPLGGLPGGGALSGGGGYALSIPLDVKLWLVPPRAGGVSPTVRLVGAYGRENWGNGQTSIALGGSFLVGATYMFDDTIGFSLEAGGRYGRSWREAFGITFTEDQFGIAYRGSLILRI